MRQKDNDSPKQRHEDNFGFLDDRIQLLDTIHQMIDIEFERRHMLVQKDENHPKCPSSNSAECRPPATSPPRRTLWQRIVGLFIAW